MQPIFAASLFDNPLVVAAFIIAGAIIHWLNQKRQQKEEAEQDEARVPRAGEVPASEITLEERLRQLLGEAPPAPPPLPAPRSVPPPPPPPPPLSTTRGARSPSTLSTAPAETLTEAIAQRTMRKQRGNLPPPVNVPRSARTLMASRQSAEEASLRFEHLNEQGRNPAKAVGLKHRRRHRVGEEAIRWRDRESARRAFVASLVFGPPKGLEP